MESANLPIWATALIAGGSALFGAVVGGTVAGLLELWRQVVAGLAASRILRIELSTNATVIDFLLNPVIEREVMNVDFQDDAWLQLRIAVAPLLSESDLGYLQATYSAIPMYRGLAATLRETGSDQRSEQNLAAWKRQIGLAKAKLREMERTGRYRLFWRLLGPQPKDSPVLEPSERWADNLDESERRR